MTNRKTIYWGEQTQKALANFPFSTPKTPWGLIVAFVQIKLSAVTANYAIKRVSKKQFEAISRACKEILQGQWAEQFVLPALQGGAGTSLHMNVNEVIATRATEILGETIHPNDLVNLGQSTNDVNPSALRIESFRQVNQLAEVVREAIKVLKQLAHKTRHHLKLGRTHLQDAVPITLGEEFLAYADTLDNELNKVMGAQKALLNLNLGGTAVGNSVNAPVAFRQAMYKALSTITKINFREAKNKMAQTGTAGDLVSLSSALTGLAGALSKMASDLRLLASGPKGGLGEISLAELQKGSSIMPGKVNPVLLEALNQVYFLVSGNNHTIELAGASAQLELSAMGPVIAFRLLESLTLLREVVQVATEKCLKLIEPVPANCLKHLKASTAVATLFTPVLGYDVVAGLVKESLKQQVDFLSLLQTQRLLSQQQIDKLLKLKPSA